MAKKKSVKQRTVKMHSHQSKIEKSNIPGLSKGKADGIMALMAAVLVILTSLIDTKISVILAAILMILFAAYKLIRR